MIARHIQGCAQQQEVVQHAIIGCRLGAPSFNPGYSSSCRLIATSRPGQGLSRAKTIISCAIILLRRDGEAYFWRIGRPRNKGDRRATLVGASELDPQLSTAQAAAGPHGFFD